MKSNFVVSKTGFRVEDVDTHHVLTVEYSKGLYHGVVSIDEMGINLPLSQWRKGESPFQDDFCFTGSGRHPKGSWEFVIRPCESFSSIMVEVEQLNENVGIFRKIFRKNTAGTSTPEKLIDIVRKSFNAMKEEICLEYLRKKS